ncbi:MAG: hypothetical protein US54_C0069G0005 [Candidatus Roizmanbacteria bacterium GW2011_GWA2_37_7]|uniref:N-acetyltransferase domain-containing protein n=1 Tax=Candidatus Roizmanbacteria bacterium GW2011_GWA2_37_7 TaxID=1618481 RepID=A0A0G0JI01_9BACT|nr:MAG: hypothetical protein US54_C0069G0005 [Candidatus Roizmanbacteria bacterium GW2011_GWA2_37_7]
MNISSINLVAFDNRFIETIKDYKKIHLKEGEGTYYTITANKKKAGVIGFQTEKDGNIGLKIGIHQDFRGQGVFGKALTLLAKKHTFDKIYSEVAIANIASVKAHEKVGFKRIPKKKEEELKEKGLMYKRNMMLVKNIKFQNY